jgi:mRNA interferase RelE/StbE
VTYTVEIVPAASRQLRKLDRRFQGRILACLATLEEDPRPQESVKLEGQDNLYRIRTGDFRILYRVFDTRLLILVVKIGNRREVYRRL